VAIPPEEIVTTVVPRTPPPGVTPSERRASKATSPVQLRMVALAASFATTVTVKAAPAVAVGEALT